MTIRLVRYQRTHSNGFMERAGGPRVGLLTREGDILDVTDAWRHTGVPTPWQDDESLALGRILAAGEHIAKSLATLTCSPPEEHVIDRRQAHLLAPVTPATIVASGWNFADHVEETRDLVGATIPSDPTGFLKLPAVVVGPGDDVERPSRVQQLDCEVELAAVLARPVFRASQAEASRAIGGFTLMNDVSARDVQEPEMKAGLLLAGKNFPTFAPFGPTVVPAWDFDVSAARLRTGVNGEVRQDALASRAIRDLASLVEYWSGVFPLAAGDVVTLGSPPGVAYGGSEKYLVPGDVVELEERQIGVLRNRVVSSPRFGL